MRKLHKILFIRDGGAIFQGAIFLGENFPGGNFLRGIFPGDKFPGSNFLEGHFFWGHFSIKTNGLIVLSNFNQIKYLQLVLVSNNFETTILSTVRFQIFNRLFLIPFFAA